MPTTLARAAAWAAAFLPALAAAQTLDFDQALSLAAERSEAARAAQAAASSARHATVRAGQLPDPVLRAGIENLPVTGGDRFHTAREAMTMKRLGLSQEWVSAGKRAARESAARAMAERESAQEEAARADARLQAALAYVEAWYAAEDLKLAARAERQRREELETARSRLAAGGAASAEVLRQLSTLGMAEDESAGARQQQAAALAGLQRWVGFRPSALSNAPAFEIPGEQDYLARHPTVATLQRALEGARRNAESAARERTPNWTWELAYGQRTGASDLVSVGVSIPLPWAPAQRQDRDAAARWALVDQAEAELAEAARAATAQYRALASDAALLRQRLDRYRGSVLAPAGHRTAATLAAYRSNQSPLSALFEARQAEVEAERRLLALQRELARSQARLALTPLWQGAAP